MTYCKSLHSFREGRGTWTATFEVKLIQQVAALREAVIHSIFLDLHKSYDALDESRCLDILDGYSVGPRSLLFLLGYWDQLNMMAQAGGYYREPLFRERGVTQGNPRTTGNHWWKNGMGGASLVMTKMRRRRWGGQSGNETTADGGHRRYMKGRG